MFGLFVPTYRVKNVFSFGTDEDDHALPASVSLAASLFSILDAGGKTKSEAIVAGGAGIDKDKTDVQKAQWKESIRAMKLNKVERDSSDAGIFLYK